MFFVILNQVPPVEYFKHVILELQNENDTSQSKNQHPTTSSKTSIHALQKRFEEVSKIKKNNQKLKNDDLLY